jgi:hypothetical protein
MSSKEQAPAESRPLTGPERVAKMRAERAAAGLKRLELYVHPDDWPAVKKLAAKLQRKRESA